MNAVLDLPEIGDRHAFNLARWKEICADPQVLAIEGRVESDTHGHILMSPPPAFEHSQLQYRIARLLGELLGHDGASTECPVSTIKGIRAIDSVWISAERREQALRSGVLVIAPEICVEVLSPGNTRNEMEEKRALLFQSGADEVWFCDSKKRMSFFLRDAPSVAVDKSLRCPGFPDSIC